jgi:predicted MFS family arabinose efflux permease
LLDKRSDRGRVVAAYGVVVAGVTLPTPLYVVYQDRWDLSVGQITGLYALYPVGVLLVLLTAGHLPDQLGRRPVVLLAIAASFASALAFAIGTSPVVLAAGRLLTGIASGVVVGAATLLLVELSAPSQRRRTSVLATTVNQLGLGLGALVSGVLVQYVWQPTRLVFVIDLVALAVAARLMRAVPETAPSAGRVRFELRSLRLPERRRREFVAASLAAFAGFALCGLLAALAPSIVRHQLGSDNALLGGAAVFVVFGVSGMSQLGWHRLPDLAVMRTGLALLVASLAIITVGLELGSVSLFFVGVTIGGSAVGAVFMSSLARVNAQSTSEERGATTAAYFAITFSGLIVPVVATGVAADLMSQLAAITLFSVVVSVVALTSAVLTIPTRARS